MKKKLFIMSLAFVMSFVFMASDNMKDESVAVINKVVKDVNFKRGESDWQNAKPGVTLLDHDVIKTGAKSLAVVSFLDGSVVRLRENSDLTIYGNKAEKKLDKNVYIDKGAVGFDVKKQEDEEFKFTTPTMVASIRGTSGSIEVGQDGFTMATLLTGLMEIVATLGEKQSGTLNPGQTATIDSNGNVVIELTTQQQSNNANQIQNTDTKTIRIKTPAGTIVIEYLSGE
ncbi:MAG: FecR family protein [Ignavibacteriales bacterium]|nr:FecR family protein [Ignavibacteriales bacterium]MCF8306677.1 FecR family protein [Ignavibacteriales bacterium]MCF8316223.1 FecR family protein [Ignavibacteriales bacterium]MCF8437807.1 FecR family protein [Ignavibacteriales bacterium]